jgi:hypothetical protein
MEFYHFLDESTYEHVSVVLAQGLSDLKIKNYGSSNYWQEFNSGYLIENLPSDQSDCMIALVSSQYLLKNLDSIDFIKSKFRKIVLLDSEDGGESTACTHVYPKFDYVLRCHFNSKIHNFPNVFPWPWGITNHMIQWICNAREYPNSKNKVQINFRVPHQARLIGLKILQKNLPQDYFFEHKIDYIEENLTKSLSDEELNYIAQTKNRCLPGYVGRIKDNSLAFSFGGWFFDNESNCLLKYFNRALMKFRVKIPQSVSLVQFDSWRLWENFFSGTPIVHFDLDLYSAVLPVQPINGIHYLGIDIKGKVNGVDLKDYLDDLDGIGRAGLKFATDHYTPKEIARRFITILNREAKN